MLKASKIAINGNIAISSILLTSSTLNEKDSLYEKEVIAKFGRTHALNSSLYKDRMSLI